MPEPIDEQCAFGLVGLPLNRSALTPARPGTARSSARDRPAPGQACASKAVGARQRWQDRAVSGERVPYPEPALADGRVALRKWREADVDCIRLAGADPAITAGTTVPAAFTEAEGLAFIRRQWQRAEDGEGVSLAITDAVDRAVGLMWVAVRPQRGVGGLGYWVIPPERGKGYASASVRLVVPWALGALRLQRLEAWVEPANGKAPVTSS